ncbi:MAG: 16S rRNA (adenine(1518)-N(6)/adenine(1519)-N(6))-dimethyltransferase RsmA [Patescibacteria group bacterium]|nr:16S rRNA (adenine(1518)-N(6)/adenine(1519)-N(6))-dimethyltransferase RsmA [Patescibacteria group bacterium]
MDLVSKLEVKNLLKKYRFLPSKRLGQNFLIDKKVLKKIIEAAELSEDDIVLEIGPGTGNLTIALAKKVKKVVIIEKDPKMIEILKETLKDLKNIEIIQDDIRKIGNWKLEIGNYKVVANLPFYLTAPVIRKFLESVEVKPLEMVLVVQKEVAQRICAKVPDMNLLAVSVQFYAQPKIIRYISKKSFWPQPEVDSAILRITEISTNRKIDSDKFFKIVKAGFSRPRKQILNNLSKMLKLDKKKVKSWLLKNGIQPGQRAETLKINDWMKLTCSLPF